MAKARYRISAKHKQLLKKHWKRYRALDLANRTPKSDAERHFVEVCRGRAQPSSEHELAYQSGQELIAMSRFSAQEVYRRGFDLSSNEMMDVALYRAASSQSNHPPVQHHDVDINRYGAARRTVRKYNW